MLNHAVWITPLMHCYRRLHIVHIWPSSFSCPEATLAGALSATSATTTTSVPTTLKSNRDHQNSSHSQHVRVPSPFLTYLQAKAVWCLCCHLVTCIPTRHTTHAYTQSMQCPSQCPSQSVMPSFYKSGGNNASSRLKLSGAFAATSDTSQHT